MAPDAPVTLHQSNRLAADTPVHWAMQWPCLVWRYNPSARRESFPYEGLNEVYLQNFLGMGVTFRDESNDVN